METENLDDLTETSATDVPWDDGADDLEEALLSSSEDESSEESDNSLILLSHEKFAALHNIMKILKNTCQDFIVHNGVIRQHNDKKSCIFEFDVSCLFTGFDELMLTGLAQKFDILEPFKKQNVEVILTKSVKGYTFRDSRSKIQLSHPIKEYLTNKFIEPTELTQKIKMTNQKIFEFTLDATLLDRLSSYTKVLAAQVLKLEFKNGKATFNISPIDNASSTNIKLVTLEDELEETDLEGSMGFIIEPFTGIKDGGISDIKIEMYRTVNNLYCMKLTSLMPVEGEELEIPVSIWILSQLKDLDS